MLNYLDRKPSQEKMRRGILLIERVIDQFPWYEDAKSTLDMCPDWRTDYRHHAAVIRLARRIGAKSYKHVTEGKGQEGIWPVMWGYIESIGQFLPDYQNILEKATDIVYERVEGHVPSEEEVKRILDSFKKDQVDFYDVQVVLGIVDRHDVKCRLREKLDKYLERKRDAEN